MSLCTSNIVFILICWWLEIFFLYLFCRQEVLHWGNEISHNEDIIEEREQGVKDIHDQIGEASEIFEGVIIGKSLTKLEGSVCLLCFLNLHITNCLNRCRWYSIKYLGFIFWNSTSKGAAFGGNKRWQL